MFNISPVIPAQSNSLVVSLQFPFHYVVHCLRQMLSYPHSKSEDTNCDPLNLNKTKKGKVSIFEYFTLYFLISGLGLRC